MDGFRFNSPSSKPARAPAPAEDARIYLDGRGETVWSINRAENLLLEATGTTNEMPGGMERLTHENKYKSHC
jgi:hypothetical protein